MTLDENTFRDLAGKTLSRLADAVEEALGDRLDVDLGEGVLTIELDSGATYVINGHAPSRQIWMASPVSGGLHFDYESEGEGGRWIATRGGADLVPLLARELAEATGVPLDLEGPVHPEGLIQ